MDDRFGGLTRGGVVLSVPVILSMETTGDWMVGVYDGDVFVGDVCVLVFHDCETSSGFFYRGGLWRKHGLGCLTEHHVGRRVGVRYVSSVKTGKGFCAVLDVRLLPVADLCDNLEVVTREGGVKNETERA